MPSLTHWVKWFASATGEKSQWGLFFGGNLNIKASDCTKATMENYATTVHNSAKPIHSTGKKTQWAKVGGKQDMQSAQLCPVLLNFAQLCPGVHCTVVLNCAQAPSCILKVGFAFSTQATFIKICVNTSNVHSEWKRQNIDTLQNSFVVINYQHWTGAL